MSTTYSEMKAALDAKMPLNSVSERDAGQGRKLSYISSYEVLQQMNAIIGQGNWQYDTQEMRLVHSGTETDYRGQPKHVAHYIAKVHLVVNLPEGRIAMFSDYGYGDGQDKQSPGKAHELAVKEAATDALKRCAKNLGMRMGLALYSKEQENVETAEDTAEAKQAAPMGSQKPSSVGETQPAAAENSTPDRKRINTAITQTSKVVLAQGKATMVELKNALSEHGVKAKEELTDVQATQFLAKLEAIANGPRPTLN